FLFGQQTLCTLTIGWAGVRAADGGNRVIRDTIRRPTAGKDVSVAVSCALASAAFWAAMWHPEPDDLAQRAVLAMLAVTVYRAVGTQGCQYVSTGGSSSTVHTVTGDTAL